MSMEPSEIYGVMVGVIELMNSNIEFWLTLTFATIMAFHFALSSITLGLYRLVVGLYALASALFIVRAGHAFRQFDQFNQRLIEAGFPPYPSDPIIGWPIFVATFVLMIGGTLACITYMLRTYRAKPREEI